MQKEVKALHTALSRYQAGEKEEARMMLAMSTILQALSNACGQRAVGACAAQCRDQDLEIHSKNFQNSLQSAELLIACLPNLEGQ